MSPFSDSEYSSASDGHYDDSASDRYDQPTCVLSSLNGEPKTSTTMRELMSYLSAHPVNVASECPELGARYRRKRVLGRGRMGVVVAAEDLVLGRTVALKSMRSKDAKDKSSGLSRLIEEARITAQLEHPGIVSVYDLAVLADGGICYTMKRVRGEPLSRVLERLSAGDAETRARFPLNRRLAIFVQVCQAVSYAHRLNVLHPHNWAAPDALFDRRQRRAPITCASPDCLLLGGNNDVINPSIKMETSQAYVFSQDKSVNPWETAGSLGLGLEQTVDIDGSRFPAPTHLNLMPLL